MTHPFNPTTFLSSARVSPEIFSLRPDYRVLLLVATELSPSGPSNPQSEAFLVSAETATQSALAEFPSVQEIPHVAAWRETYKLFGAKPNKTRNSLEALTRRCPAAGGTGLPRVNALTDIYNAISVKHQIPFGGEDLGGYVGAAELVRAKGDEEFHTTAGGKEVVESPEVGEAVWRDAKGVTCRRWNWRQGTRTALTGESTEVLFILDVLKPITDEALESAVEELMGALRETSPEVKFERRLIGAEDVKER